MAIYDFFVSRNGAAANTASYIGHTGRLFYDDVNGVVKLSDGVTPGGTAIPYTIATSTVVGGIKAGAGANVSLDGTLTIDTSGLPLSIGNLNIADTTISSVNLNQDVILESNGTGNVDVVGQFQVYSVDGPISTRDPEFQISNTGIITARITQTDTVGAMRIIASASGNVVSPAVSGVMLHITGNVGQFASQYIDGVANFPNYILRRYNNNATSPTQLSSGDVIGRLSAQGYTGGGFSPLGASASISFVALEDYSTLSNIGSQIQFLAIPIGSNVRSQVASIDHTDGLTAIKAKITGNLTVEGDLLGNAQSTTATIGTAEITTANITNSTTTGTAVIGTANVTTVNTTGNITAAKMNIASGGLRTINGGIYANLNFATDSIVHLYHPTSDVNINLSNYKAGSTVRLIIRLATRQSINFGVASTQNSTKGALSISNTSLLDNSAVILNYICMDGTAGNTFVGVNTVD